MRITLLSRGLPKLSAMAAVKYAPPAMPPRKKYQTMRRCQSGALSMAAVLGVTALGRATIGTTSLPEGEQRPHPDQQGRADGQERVHDHIALGKGRLLGQGVGRRLVEKEEEGVEATQGAIGVGAVELRLLVAHSFQRLHALTRLGHELVPEAELYRFRGTGLGAGGSQPVVDAVIAEGAFIGPSRVVIERHHTEGAGADAVAATIADILVDVDGAVLRPVDGAGGARLEAAGLGAVLADV